MPLSEHEQRVLQELEHALYQDDPAFAHRVRSETVYRHAGRYVKWSVAGFVAGMIVMLAFFSTSVLLGFVGFLIMFLSLVTLWTNLARMGKAGLHDFRRSAHGERAGGVIDDAQRWLRERFHREG
ncbi:MAG: DUF3040 domain-containing protein [Acidimicrobiales bacterium]|jgi:hypothetical protein|nr:DUF3040 domain-containing protein [Actinomycetota bacterium]MDA8184205.1 DUF3040 domain-containing protein [Actinomycetota bacterium]